MGKRSPSIISRFVGPACSMLFLIAVSSAQAERLPIKIYTSADGLVSDRVSRIVRDPRGFLWFCTEHGLSRFDGNNFVNYTTDHGLPANWVNDLLITRDGQYWVATEEGVCRFFPNSASAPMFVASRPSEDERDSRIKALYEDRAGAIWCGTWKNLYRLEPTPDHTAFHRVEIGMPDDEPSVIRSLIEDSRGRLWVASDSGLYRLSPDGRAERFSARGGLDNHNMMGLLEDSKGRLWAGSRQGGLCLIATDQKELEAARRYTVRDGLQCNDISALLQTSDGRLWVGTDCGLSEMLPEGSRPSLRNHALTQALSELNIWCMAEDREGNLWIGSPGGAIKIALRGFTIYTAADGLISNGVVEVFKSQTGEVIVSANSPDSLKFAEFDGQRFNNAGFSLNGLRGVLQDHTGQWWGYSASELYRFAEVSRFRDLARVRPVVLSTAGLPGRGFYKLHEDARGDLWIGVSARPRGWLIRWERATGRFHNHSEAEGLPPLSDNTVSAFCNDRAGNLWLGFSGGSLARYREGRFDLFSASDGVPLGLIRSLFVDREGRLWIAASRGGVSRIDDVMAERPSFAHLTTADGLSSNDAWCITDDAQGRIYIGTTRGLDRIDQASGRMRHYTTADGLANQTVNVAFRDHQGAMWFGTNTGLSRLIPDIERSVDLPSSVISKMEVGGQAQPIAPMGETDAAGFEFGPGQNNISIEFLSISFLAAVRHEYKLEGVEGDWSAPTFERRVNYASLRPGTYRFLVRSIGVDGAAGPNPASVTFTILPPVWRRWWFLTLGALLAISLIYGAHRYRVARLVEIERVRTRIAADLHDDIGSSLSQIAVLNEVLRKQLGSKEEPVERTLTLISRISQEALDGMSDIVWAINPRQDHISDLARRMRRFASEILPGRDIEFDFQAPASERDLRVGADMRRQIFLIFKETINNIVRHSGCRRAGIEMKTEGGMLVVVVSDDGKGFDTNSAEGNGLASLRRRATALGGRVFVSSAAGRGTTVTLKVPYRRTFRGGDKSESLSSK
ncbi:MAG: two-component regulator propeller domain-containing protein [Acidobacteriota bacterium]